MSSPLSRCSARPVVAAAITGLILVVASCGGDQIAPDAPAALVIHSGDGQTARTGTEAVEPVRVRVTSQSGASMTGVTVAFEVTVGGGSLPASTAVTDANGIASPGRWTLGAPGPQELRASVAELDPVVFSATALGIPAEIAVVAGADQEAPVATAVAVPPEVLVTDADGAPLSGIPVVFTTERDATVASAEVSTDARGRAGPGAWTLGTSTGVYGLVASVEGDGIKGNPLRFEAVALAGPAARLVAVEGDGQESETRLPVPISPRVRAEDSHGNPATGVTVAFSAGGDSEVVPTETRTDSAGFAAVDKWILGTNAGATYRLTASVGGAAAAVTATFSAIATPAVYDIEIVHVNASLLTDSQRRAFESAEAFWERAITGNLDWSTVRKPAVEDYCLAKNDIDHEVAGDRVVDDLLIYVQIKEIDGPAGVFGGAGPCMIRDGEGDPRTNSQPVVGVMFFDLGDMDGLEANGHLAGTILHEMAHVIGFGTLWDHLGLLHDPARHGRSADTHFSGDSAVAAFDGIRGDHYTDSDLVPVQNLGGDGVWNGHWRELVFRTELMTPFPDRGLNPLSVVSIASLVDIGYEGVDLGVADEYVLPPPLYGRVAGEATGADRVGADGLGDPDYVIDLSDDILRLPLAAIDRDGNLIRVIQPRSR